MTTHDTSSPERIANYSGVGLTKGASIGSIVGAVLGNFGVGLIVGAMVGIVFGPALGLAMQQSAEVPPAAE